ncbi:uncharacterized protein V6R79_020446 [Siganus canaliculatus]
MDATTCVRRSRPPQVITDWRDIFRVAVAQINQIMPLKSVSLICKQTELSDRCDLSDGCMHPVMSNSRISFILRI